MNIWTGLLFLDGAIADASLAREMGAEPAPARADARDGDAPKAEPRDALVAAIH